MTDILEAIETDASTVGKDILAGLKTVGSLFEKTAAANPAVAGNLANLATQAKATATAVETQAPVLATGVANGLLASYGLSEFTPEADLFIQWAVPALEALMTKNKPTT